MQVHSLPRFLSSTFCPFFVLGPLFNTNIKKKGTLIMKGILRNLAADADVKFG